MQTRTTRHFDRSYVKTPPDVRKVFLKQAVLFVRDLRYPSLHAKKYDEAGDVWQARVNDDWRFYFRIEGDTYVFLDIVHHPK